MDQPVLWIQLENDNRPKKYPIKDGNLNHNLGELAISLCTRKNKRKPLSDNPNKLKFFGDYDKSQYDDGNGGDDDDDNSGDNKPLRLDIKLLHLRNSAFKPLIVRYPLSNNMISAYVNVSSVDIPHGTINVTLEHSTGSWDKLLSWLKNLDGTLQDEVIYFVDSKTKTNVIRNQVSFNELLKHTTANKRNQLVVKLTPQIIVKDPEEIYKKLIGNLFFLVQKFKNFKSSDLDIPVNDIVWDSRLQIKPVDQNDPQFVQDFVNNLNKKRTIDSSETLYLPILKDRMKLNLFSKDMSTEEMPTEGMPAENMPAEETTPEVRFSDFFQDMPTEETTPDVNIDELAAYLAVFDIFAPKSATVVTKSFFFMDSHFTSFLIDPALFEFLEYDKGINWTPTLLVMEQGTENARSYKPKGDFLLGSPYGLFLLGETVSDEDESDRFRMLLQASVVCRIANTTQKGKKNFVLLCYYVNKEYKAERYIIWQSNGTSDRKVSIKMDQKIDLTNANDAFKILFQMFNFKKLMPKLQDKFDQKKDKVMKAIDLLTKKFHKMALSSQDSKQSNQQSSKQGDRPSIRENAVTLRKHGYVIKKTLHNLPHVALAAKMHALVVIKCIKCIKNQSDELKILQMLNSTDLQSDQKNHTIPLLDVVPLDENTLAIIMPNFRSLLVTAPPGLLRPVNLTEAQIFSLAKQLLEGVNFLHERNIAHLDIKPDNLVIDGHNRLVIIDFGLARKLESKETTVTGYRGTKGYAAPEIEDEEVYNPFQADIWSVGTVISKLLNEYSSAVIQTKLGYINIILSRLTVMSPSERPSASEAMQMLEQADPYTKKRKAKPANANHGHRMSKQVTWISGM